MLILGHDEFYINLNQLIFIDHNHSIFFPSSIFTVNTPAIRLTFNFFLKAITISLLAFTFLTIASFFIQIFFFLVNFFFVFAVPTATFYSTGVFVFKALAVKTRTL